jgi:hypothetical protein
MKKMNLSKMLYLMIILLMSVYITADDCDCSPKNESKNIYKKMIWTAEEGCGCAYSYDYITYWFYNSYEKEDNDNKLALIPPDTEPTADPAAVKKDDEKKQADTKEIKIDFSAASRIGYFTLIPENDGTFSELRDWKNPQFIKTAQKHNTKIDLVISYNGYENKDYKILTSPVIRDKFIKNIIELVHEYGKEKISCNGVTINFYGFTKNQKQDYKIFLEKLKDNLTKKGSDYLLNIIVPFDTKGNTIFEKSFFYEISHLIDIFIIIGEDRKPVSGDDILKIPKWAGELDIIKKSLPVIKVYNNDNFKNNYKNIEKIKFKGAGLWTASALYEDDKKDVIKFIQDRLSPDKNYRDFFKYTYLSLDKEEVLCRFLCPKTKPVGIIIGFVILIYCLVFFVYKFGNKYRSFLKKFLIISTVLLFISIELWILCSPFSSVWRHITALSVIGIYIAYGIILKGWIKYKEDFP